MRYADRHRAGAGEAALILSRERDVIDAAGLLGNPRAVRMPFHRLQGIGGLRHAGALAAGAHRSNELSKQYSRGADTNPVGRDEVLGADR